MGKKELAELIQDGALKIEDLVDVIVTIGGADKKYLASKLLGVDLDRVIQEMFMGYKQRKQRKQLYNADKDIPRDLIIMYYNFADRMPFESLKNAFVNRYIKEECKLEGVHSPAEIEGLGVMYEYIHSDEIDYIFDVFTLKEIHQKLYSKTTYPEFGGDFRRSDAHIKNFPVDLVPWPYIFRALDELDPEVRELKRISAVIKDSGDANVLLNYLDRCVVLGCKLVKIHPFADGNGRSVRGFINKLLVDAGLPPIYIKAAEKDEYIEAMDKAVGEEDYSSILNFYRYKICDSIVELDINPRIRKQISGEDTTGIAKTSGVVKSKADDKK